MAGGRVLELGAGMSGLAGLGVAACSDAAEVVITDGNPDALKNLEVRVFVCVCPARLRSIVSCVSPLSGCPQAAVKKSTRLKAVLDVGTCF